MNTSVITTRGFHQSAVIRKTSDFVYMLKRLISIDEYIIIKILNRMGFPQVVLTWIINLYTNIQSSCMVNGFLTDSFNIYKGVRQGCPLSMMLFVIFQNPLYVALESSRNIRSLEIMGSNMI